MSTPTSATDLTAADLMTNKVHTVMVNDSIQDAIVLMVDNQLTTLPVISGDEECIGMLSRSDLNELFLDEDNELSRLSDPGGFSVGWLNGSLETLQGRQVQEFMTMNVTRIEPAQSLKKVCQEMKRHNIHHLPVVDDGNKLVGIVSAFDVVKAIAENG